MKTLALALALVACGNHGKPATSQGSGSAVQATPDVAAQTPPDAPQETTAVTSTGPALASADDSFDYQVGNPNFKGRTHVHVTGDGTADVSRERGGKTESFKGTVPAAKLKALRESLTKHPVSGYKTGNRPLVPDESTIDLVVVTGGAKVTSSIPDNDRHTIAPLGELVDLVNEIAAPGSGGKIEY